jgi:adenine-specific DNA-methyltransferase
MTEIDRLDNKSDDILANRIEALRRLIPEAFSEGGIDFDKLRLLLGDEVDEGDERYAFTWPGKADAIRQSQTTTTATLRPCLEKSRGRTGEDGSFDSDNVYIEGDNLEVLKLMQRAYHGKVKLIYIDPPYNTGHDFVYKDKFGDTIRNYKEQTRQTNQSNPETSGRFHSDWCSMMYPRLKLSRELISNDGYIFISIDNNEVRNAKFLCDEIFGESCFVAQFTWEKKKKSSFLSKSVSNIIEYVLCYCKDPGNAKPLIGEINNNTETYPCVNAVNGRELRHIPAGIVSKYKEKDYTLPKGSVISNSTMSLVLCSDLIIKNGVLAKDLDIEGNWRYSQEAMTQYALDRELYVTQDLYLRRIVGDTRLKTMKDLLPRVGSNPDAKVGSINPQNLFESGWGSNEDADEELRILMGVQKILDYPKPVSLLAKLICACRLKDEDIVLDFFSGSGTMAHAAMYLNSLEGRFCNFILVQLPEKCGDGTVAKSAGYQTICDIGEERIRRAGSKIAREIAEENKQLKLGEEPKQLPDIGFRVFRLDDSGIERPKDGQLLIDRRKPGRTDLDIVFEAMLKWGYELTYPVEETEFAGYQCYSVAAGDLICCMRPGLTTDAIEAIAATQPRRVLMMDSAIDDTTKLNALAIFKRVEERTQQKIELRTV